MLRRALPPAATIRSVRHASTAAADVARRQTVRRVVMTGSITLITIVGAVTGAWLKVDNDAVREKRAFMETPIDDRIAILEQQRASLVALRMPLERKLGDLRERMRVKRERDAELGAGERR